MNRAPISRRVALAAASVIVLALSACGNPSPSAGSVPGTLPVIHVAGAGGAEGAMAADSVGGASSSKMMAANLSFVFDGQAPDLTGPAGSWFFPAGERVSDDAVRAVAAAMGVVGDIVTQPADMGGGRMIGSADYTQPSITVGDDALSTWWFNPGQTAVPMVSCAVVDPTIASVGGATEPVPAPDATAAVSPDVSADTVPADGVMVDPMPCEPTPPPAGVPTKDEAEAKARQHLTDLGLDPAGFELDTYADEWGANVTGYLLLDGVRTTLSISVGYGAEGAVTWASGFLASPQRSADFPRIGVEAAVQRLNDQQTDMMRGWSPAEGDALSTDSVTAEPAADAPLPAPVCPELTADTETTAVTDTPCVPIDDGTIVIEPPIDVQPMVVALADPQPSLEQVWDVDGTVWLLPGYSFTSTDGGIWSVTAIPDDYLQIDDAAVEPAPLPVETAPTETAPQDATPADSVPVDEAWDVYPAGPPSAEAAAIALVGRSLDDLLTIPWTVRVVRQDGADLAVTADFQASRVNVFVVDGVVTEVQGLG
ncbi:MAG: hypothetical protein WEB78_06640 [Ilumatobacteraceae bacterium]